MFLSVNLPSRNFKLILNIRKWLLKQPLVVAEKLRDGDDWMWTSDGFCSSKRAKSDGRWLSLCQTGRRDEQLKWSKTDNDFFLTFRNVIIKIIFIKRAYKRVFLFYFKRLYVLPVCMFVCVLQIETSHLEVECQNVRLAESPPIPEEQ